MNMNVKMLYFRPSCVMLTDMADTWSVCGFCANLASTTATPIDYCVKFPTRAVDFRTDVIQ